MAGSMWNVAALRHKWISALGGTLWSLSLMTLGQAYGHDPGRGPPSDTGPPVAQKATVPPPLIEEDWHHNLVRERSAEVRLRAARKELQVGRITEALLLLQAVLDSEEDLFVRLESQPVPIGARFLADELLSSLSPEVQRVYETLHGSEARRLLAAPDASRDLQQLTQVVRRFFHTIAGGEATMRLAHHWFDHGNAALATACWQRLLTDRRHRARLQPAQLAAAALCFRRSGHLTIAQETEALFANGSVMIAGRHVLPRHWIAQFSNERIASPSPDSAVACGAADRNGSAPGTIPALGRPLWTVPLAGKGSEHVTVLANAWETFQRQNGLPIGAAHVPLLVGDRLIFRDFEGIRAVSVQTGTTLWFYRTISSVSHDIAPQPGIPTEGNPDPNDAMRWLVGNSMMGTLASDGRNVFLIDRSETDSPAQGASGVSPTEAPILPFRQGNVLMALAVAPSNSANPIEPVWTIGGHPVEDGHAPRTALAGHYFLGPPLPLFDRLYVVSELQQQLYLTCLDASSGAVAWSQSLCSVSQPISIDHHRFALVCSPSYGTGVLVVPTQAGVLVAVDPITGRLLWAAAHDDGEHQHRQQMSAWPYSSRRRYGHRSYTNLPVIHQGRIVYLPAHSEHLHCFDLASGRVRWRALREGLDLSSASEYVAAIAEGSVLLVGRRRCRGLDLETGAERFSLRLGSSPAGRGVHLGTDYHIPLEDGRVVSLDVSTGRQRGSTQPGRTAGLGNLVAAGDLVISMGRTEITAWPQAEPELARLEAAPASQPAPTEIALAAAELELSLGRPSQAQTRIDLIQNAPAKSAFAARISALERDITIARLQEPGADRAALVDRLAALATTPAERGRCLIERALLERQEEPGALLATYRAVADHNLAQPLPLLDDPSRSVSLGAFVAGLIRSRDAARDATAPPGTAIDAELSAAIQAGDLPTLRRAADLYSEEPQVEQARLRLARLWFERGQHQPAELILLRCRESANPHIAGAASRILVELWQERKLFHDAARMLEELQTRFATIDVGNGELGGRMTGEEYVARYPQDRPAWEAYRRCAPPYWAGTKVRISENREPHDNLQAIYNGSGIIHLTVPHHLSLDLFDKGRSGVNGAITLFDRHTGIEHPETITIPGRYHYPVQSPTGHLQHSFVGHFLPMGGPGTIHGISLLERKMVWTTAPAGLQSARDNVRIGPAGPGFCTCQSGQHLMMLSPADGRLLWRRDDLEPRSGLMSDPAGIIGDDQVLVVFSGLETSAKSYTVYDTATGEELRRGRIDISMKTRRAYGRRLFHATAGAARRLRVWDPLTDRFVWDVPADDFAEASLLEGTAPGAKLAAFVRDSDEAAFVTKSGQILVIDLPHGETLFEISVTPAQIENLGCLRAFRDKDRYYFNLQRSQSSARTQNQQPSQIVHDAAIPTIHVQGDVCAVDRRSHEVLWTVSLGNRSIVQLPQFRLPVLVTLFRVRKGDQTSLGVEVVDVHTGETLASRDDLFSDRLLQVLYERQPGVIRLRGGKTEIRLEFPDDLSRLNAGEVLR